jgi:hypothetical protein
MPKFRLLPASHSVQRLRVELASIGKSSTTYDQVMLPETWKDAVNIQAGDEIEVVGSNFTRLVRVTSLGPAEQSAPVARHLFVCRAAPETEHMYTLIERKGDAPDFTHQQLMVGQSNLGMLVAEVIRILEQGGELPDVTFGCLDADLVREGALSNEDPLCPSWHGKTVLCREGGDALPDRWNCVNYIAGRDCPRGPRVWCGGASSRFHISSLGDKIRKEFASPTGEMDWKRFERGRWDELQVRPRWTAKQICPGAFPESKPVPEEHERAAAAKREAFMLSRNPTAAHAARKAAQQKALAEFEEMSRAKAEAKAKTEGGAS